VVLKDTSLALKIIEPAVEGTTWLNTAIPDALVTAKSVLALERVPPLAADNVTVSLEMGNELPPMTWTYAVVGMPTDVRDGSWTKAIEVGVIDWTSTRLGPQLELITVIPDPQVAEHSA
jgi:hypothetical protein